MIASITPTEIGAFPMRRINEKTPLLGEPGAFTDPAKPLSASGESASFRLDESCFGPFASDLPQDRAIERGMGRLATWRGPQSFTVHHVDQLLAVHRSSRFREHFDGGFNRTQFLLARGLSRFLELLGWLLRVC